ncbi:hypothetical protein KSZ_25600 [Dictyobacter formicarum]|uniref:Uncharacterized protein n=1 Tax=Dictyobacter formicarum TaxID=2778368 RepID=A0ABQ3VEK1_9CHLR|nr:hypothetical protein KSZ_25600 [Dictyobacter formicarum]
MPPGENGTASIDKKCTIEDTWFLISSLAYTRKDRATSTQLRSRLVGACHLITAFDNANWN